MKPQINIRYGNLIDPFFKVYVEVKYPGYVFPTEEAVLGKIKDYRLAWEKMEEIFLNSIYKITNLEFKRNIIDCFIVSATPRDMSAPLIIRSRYTPDEFVDILMHELLHILFSDNKLRGPTNKNLTERANNHVLLFAILKYFYTEILEDIERLNKVMTIPKVGNNKDYEDAWDAVNNGDYKSIISNILI